MTYTATDTYSYTISDIETVVRCFTCRPRDDRPEFRRDH